MDHEVKRSETPFLPKIQKLAERGYAKAWYIYTMEYYSVVKRKGILTLATKWKDPEDIMLSERIQTQKDKYCMIPFISGA